MLLYIILFARLLCLKKHWLPVTRVSAVGVSLRCGYERESDIIRDMHHNYYSDKECRASVDLKISFCASTKNINEVLVHIL